MPKELNLNQDIEVLVVKIGDKSYNVPLASSLSYKKAKELSKLTKANDDEKMDFFLEFFSEYIPMDVLEKLPVSALTELSKAWSGKNEENGESLGE